jgi:hypothetical protein
MRLEYEPASVTTTPESANPSGQSSPAVYARICAFGVEDSALEGGGGSYERGTPVLCAGKVPLYSVLGSTSYVNKSDLSPTPPSLPTPLDRARRLCMRGSASLECRL